MEIMKELVEQSIRTLGPEIHHTDSRQYRAELQKRRETLEQIAARLENVPAMSVPVR